MFRISPYLYSTEMTGFERAASCTFKPNSTSEVLACIGIPKTHRAYKKILCFFDLVSHINCKMPNELYTIGSIYMYQPFTPHHPSL